MAKLVTVKALNCTKVCDTFVRQFWLFRVGGGSAGKRRVNQRTNRCLGRGRRGLCLRTEGNSVAFGALLLVCSYLDLLIDSRTVLRKSSYVNRAVVIVRGNSGLQVPDQLIVKVILKVLLTKAALRSQTQELRVEFLEKLTWTHTQVLKLTTRVVCLVWV